jgi:hypothetical protein
VAPPGVRRAGVGLAGKGGVALDPARVRLVGHKIGDMVPLWHFVLNFQRLAPSIRCGPSVAPSDAPLSP